MLVFLLAEPTEAPQRRPACTDNPVVKWAEGVSGKPVKAPRKMAGAKKATIAKTAGNPVKAPPKVVDATPAPVQEARKAALKRPRAKEDDPTTSNKVPRVGERSSPRLALKAQEAAEKARVEGVTENIAAGAQARPPPKQASKNATKPKGKKSGGRGAKGGRAVE